MSDCRFGVSPVNYPDPDPVLLAVCKVSIKKKKKKKKKSKINMLYFPLISFNTELTDKKMINPNYVFLE